VGVTAAAKAVALLGGNREEVWEWWSKGAAAVRTAKRSSRPWAEGDGRMGDDLAAAGDGWMRRRSLSACPAGRGLRFLRHAAAGDREVVAFHQITSKF